VRTPPGDGLPLFHLRRQQMRFRGAKKNRCGQRERSDGVQQNIASDMSEAPPQEIEFFEKHFRTTSCRPAFGRFRDPNTLAVIRSLVVPDLVSMSTSVVVPPSSILEFPRLDATTDS